MSSNRTLAARALPPRRLLATAIGLALVSQAALSQTGGQATVLPKLRVKADAASEPAQSYKAETMASPKYTASLRDTPQTITVIPKKVIEDQNALSLRQILGNVPGITFGAGEGGGGFGDNINLRGYSANTDITIDGVRNSAQTSRTDPFNLEQLEVIKGPNSVYAGAGSVSGTINMVSKTPKQENFTKLSAGIGTDNYYRGTADINQMLSDTTAVRVNVMAHANEVAERDHVDYERWGIAPSISFGLGTATRTTLSYLHQEDDNLPDYGVLWRNNKPVPGVDRSTFFGWKNLDEEDITNDMFTAVFEHDFSDLVTLRNLTRWARTDNYTVTSAPQGNVCLPGRVALGHTAACPTPLTPGGGTYQPSGPRGFVRDAETTLLTNVTDLTWNFKTGALQHTLVTGFAITNEDYSRDTGSLLRNADGTTPPNPTLDLYHPDNTWHGPVNHVLTEKVEAEVTNRALYVFDNIVLNEHWQINGGLRYEQNDAEFTVYPVPSGTISKLDADDNLVSGRIGLVFKPRENGSFYLAYGNSKNPVSSSLIGFARPNNSTSGLTAANVNVDPEKTISYELGTKWDLLDERLALTAAIFRNEKTNARINSNDPANPEQVLDGESRVDGLELSATGNLTNNWAIFASYAYLDSEILQGISDFERAQNIADAQKGHEISATPEHSASIWTTYLLPFGLELGYGIQYVGESYISNSRQADGSDPKIPDYTLHNALVGYRFNKHLNVRLNLNNLSDEKYWTRVRGTGWGDPGAGRSAVLSADYQF